MKKALLVLLTLVPIVVGWLINVFIMVPVVGMMLFYLLPFGVLVFWYWLGKQYAKTDWNFMVSMMLSHAAGFLSLALYIWQFMIETDETRNIFLAVLSQMYSAATPGYLLGWFAGIFEPQFQVAALQASSVVLLLIIFICGFIKEKKER